MPTDEMQAALVGALNGRVQAHSALEQKPLELDLVAPLPPRVRAYVYNATHPPGGRSLGEHKVQLIAPGQEREEKGNFDHADGRIVLLVGYEPEHEVFILWDAGLYHDFPWSRNVQVKAETVYEAFSQGIAVQERQLRKVGTETVIAAHRSRLAEAIQLRARHSLNRLLEARNA
jgi:hypothetical protein